MNQNHTVFIKCGGQWAGKCPHNISYELFIHLLQTNEVDAVITLVSYCTNCLKILLITNHINTLRPRQNGHHFANDILKCIFLDENVWIPIKISLKFVPNGPINNIPALVQIMAWRHPGDKPLSEPMMVSLPTHICIIRPQWLKGNSACAVSEMKLFYCYIVIPI